MHKPSTTELNLVFGPAAQHLAALLEAADYSSVFILVDENTAEYCLPKLEHHAWEYTPQVIRIRAGEEYKNLETCVEVWDHLVNSGADRSSILISVGGGVVTDLGGFVAASFMRGIPFVHVPTSVLGMTDAAIGGKQGVDFRMYKNYIGAFVQPLQVIIDTTFIETLPSREVRSGLAEIVKHGLIGDPGLLEMLRESEADGNYDWDAIMERSVAVKQNIVVDDVHERGLRAALNFGHTVGHAIETHSLDTPNPLRHGEAIGLGMMVEVALSESQAGLSSEHAAEALAAIRPYFGDVQWPELSIDRLWELMKKDKKKKGDEVRFSLISAIGRPVVDVLADPTEVNKAYLQFV